MKNVILGMLSEREEQEKYEKELEKISAGRNEAIYSGYLIKIKVVQEGDGYRIMLKASDFMDDYIDITDQASSEFSQELFATFFRNKKSAA